MTSRHALAVVVLGLLASGCPGRVPPPSSGDGPCVPVALWVDPSTRTAVTTRAIVDAAARRRIVLLGERHDWAEDHRWQASVLAMLHAAQPRLVVGFEAFTPAADAALGRWVAGERSVPEFLADVDWTRAWGLPPELYLPLFHTARLLGLELRGINVDRALVRRVATEGFAALAATDREHLAPPRPPSPAYRTRLATAWAEHSCRPARDDDPELARFVEAQRTWDAAMAAALARLAKASPDAIVVGIVGQGHVAYRDGIVPDLAALGHDALVLLPWDAHTDCTELPPGIADAVFGIAPLATEIPEPPPSRCDGAARDQRPR